MPAEPGGLFGAKDDRGCAEAAAGVERGPNRFRAEIAREALRRACRWQIRLEASQCEYTILRSHLAGVSPNTVDNLRARPS